MYEVDGIVYAGEPGKPVELISVTSAKPLKDYKLLLCFSTGEKKQYDVKPLLKYPAFKPLKNKTIFNSVRVKYGAPIWNKGQIDIDPECLYENGIAVSTLKATA
ncbi:hypothetical protein RDn1_281 [Candidatus Termititenax dinenymphae]|uniref:DUF2442 domain-containing protein n=1 Tax=Candidatus Termititenax dinenymphae TaxID=2218523 RepID=A0A388TKQ4_9BACT|nr:hypothetical protein RDn1_281 [Candidatus Termititenax dinenymphae]